MLQESVIEVASPSKGQFKDKEKAREAARRSVEVRRAKAEQKRLDTLAAPPTDLPPVEETDGFTTERIARVRRQLRMIDSLIDHERDPQRLDRLASAQLRLSEQERVLSGRPLPGSRRPGRERTTRETRSASPLDLSSSNPTE